MGRLLFSKARDRKHRRHEPEACWLPAEGTEPATLLMHKPLCHSLLSPFCQRGGPRAAPPWPLLWAPSRCFCCGTQFLHHVPPLLVPPSTQTLLEIRVCLAQKDPPCCWTLGPHNFVKDESFCRGKPLPFSWSGLIYQRYFSVSTQLFSEKENKIFLPRAIGPAKTLAIVNLTKHRTLLPK